MMDLMEKYVAKRHALRQTHGFHAHHFAWGVVCIILVAVIMGIWSQAQLLQTQNNTLKRKLAVATSDQPTCRATDSWKKDSTQEFTTQIDGMKRSYLVHTPADFDKTEYYSLVIHYGGKGISAHVSETGFGLNTLPAIVAYPQPTIGKDGAYSWQGAPYSSGADDTAFTSKIIDELQAKLCINRTKVYVTGFSNGGGFAALLSCQIPEKIAAVAVVAAAIYKPYDTCTPEQPVSLLSIHSDNDLAVPYYGSTARNLPSIHDWVARRARDDGCRVSNQTLLNISLSRTTWQQCHDGSEVQAIRVLGGQHGWGYVDNDYIWKFLSRFSH